MYVPVVVVEGETDLHTGGPIGYATRPKEVMTSKYCVAQVIFNMVGSCVGPTFCFWILFAVIGQGPYYWYGPQVLGPIGGGTFFSSILCMVLQPMGMPDAVQKGWFRVIRTQDVPSCLLCLIKWRNGMARHLCVAVALIPIYWAPAVLLARFVACDEENAEGELIMMATWTQIWFGVIYSITIAPSVTMIGLLGFALEHNYARVERTMSQAPNPLLRFVLRFLGCLRLLC